MLRVFLNFVLIQLFPFITSLNVLMVQCHTPTSCPLKQTVYHNQVIYFFQIYDELEKIHFKGYYHTSTGSESKIRFTLATLDYSNTIPL